MAIGEPLRQLTALEVFMAIDEQMEREKAERRALKLKPSRHAAAKRVQTEMREEQT